MPDMLHYHNDLIKAAFRFAGYKLDVVPEYRELTQSVYKTVNPDYCTCAIGIVGNLLTMAEDPRFAGKPIAFLEPQMGGACRAGNYYELIISSLRRCGHEEIPVLSLNLKGQEKQPGFRINGRMLFASLAAISLSDLLMSLLPRAQLLLELIEAFIPYAFGIDDQTFLENILSQYQVLLTRCLEHLAENGWQKGSSLRVGFCFYIP